MHAIGHAQYRHCRILFEKQAKQRMKPENLRSRRYVPADWKHLRRAMNADVTEGTVPAPEDAEPSRAMTLVSASHGPGLDVPSVFQPSSI